MERTNICKISNDLYSLVRDVDPNKLVLLKNDFPVCVIIRKELSNWKGNQVRFRPFSSPAELDLDEDVLFALDEALLYLKEKYGA